MKKLLIAATAILITAGSLQAQTEKQQDRKQTHHKGMHAKKSMQQLNLSDDQKKQIKELNAGYQKQFSELRSNNNITVGDYKSKTAALKKEQHEKMQALLTPEQKTQLAAQRKEGARKMKEGQAKHVDQMKTKLGLSDEQVTKIKAGQAGLHDKIKSIHQDQSLSDTQKKEQVRSAMKQQRDEMKSILTPEQIQKMKTARKSRGAESAK